MSECQRCDKKDVIIDGLANALSNIIKWQEHRNHLQAMGCERLPILAQSVWEGAREAVNRAEEEADD